MEEGQLAALSSSLWLLSLKYFEVLSSIARLHKLIRLAYRL